MPHSPILVQNLCFFLPSGQCLFDALNLSFSTEKTAVIGKNGVGKSTLLKLITGELEPSSGAMHIEGRIAYLPQMMVVPDNLSSRERNQSIAAFMGCEEKLQALNRIAQGSIEPEDFACVENEWGLETLLQKQLNAFGLKNLGFERPLCTLSGGELTRLHLARAFFRQADFLILDEPTNHLDQAARKQLYEALLSWKGGLIVVSHDRALLNLMHHIVELTPTGTVHYTGNYDDYQVQKTLQQQAHEKNVGHAKNLLQKMKNAVQLTKEKHQRKQHEGKALKRGGSIDKLSAGAKKDQSERTQKSVTLKSERLQKTAETALQQAQGKRELTEEIRIALPAISVPNSKIILEIKDLNFSYPNSHKKIISNFNFTLQGAQRIALVGNNGSGKTTLFKLIMQDLPPDSGAIVRGTPFIRYLDQQASLLNPDLSLVENFLKLNPEATQSDAYSHLARFLFKNTAAEKPAKHLSGGEKLRALLACVLMANDPPQLLLLDEPTNHLDLSSLTSLESALNCYQGAMMVISHDAVFLERIGIKQFISLEKEPA